jgi:antitoxin (DNA-binding transcriptional repressor) of toxin-antitoxin stability system
MRERLDESFSYDYYSHMKKANVSQAKSGLSRYLNDVQRGETVLIFDRDRLVARLEPVNNADVPEAERMNFLVKSGIALAPRRRLEIGAFLDLPRPRLPRDASAVEAVVRDRDDR